MERIDYNEENYYFGGIKDDPFGDPTIFPLRQEDIDKLAPGSGGTGNVDPEQTEVTYTENGVNVIEPSEGFDGMSSVKVTVEVPQKTVKDDTVEISTNENGTVDVLAADYDVDGLKEVSIAVNVPSPSIKPEPVSLTFNENRTYTISAEEYNVDGLSSVDIVVDVPSAPSVTKFYYSNGFMTESDDTTITNNSYSSDSSLVSVVIGDNVTSIGNDAFNNCSSLTSIIIPNSVTSIGGSAFYGCEGLDSVTINSNYIMSKGLKMGTIFGKQVTEYIIGGSVTSIGTEAFHDCYSLQSVTIGNSVTSIGDRAFFECSDLESVTIPNSVISIGTGAFSYCYSLTSVTIPNSVTSIGNEAFGSTDEIILESNTPISLYRYYRVIEAFGSIESGSGSGSGGGRDLKIYVPMEAFDDYYDSTDPGWVYYRDCLVGYN